MAEILLELTEQEIKQVLGTAVKQMVRIAREPSTDVELETLASVINKCSKATKSLESRSKSPITLVKSASSKR